MVKIEVSIHSSGDIWINREEVIDAIYKINQTDLVIFHTRNEGISLKSSGVLQVIDDWVTVADRDPATVTIDTPNQYEKINYKFTTVVDCGGHFFGRPLIKYYRVYSKIDPNAKIFGLFLGRYQYMRNIIAKTMLTNYYSNCLISIMQASRYFNTNPWWDPEVEAIGSLDGADIKDQYDGKHNTNQSLLQFYNDFQIEIVAETITLGESFFPTEKTVRPIMGSKPFITYAPANYLANLRNIGFQTFDSIWSEDYDQYEGVERWNRMQSVIDDIIHNGYDCNRAQEIVQYNYNHLQTVINRTD
jgi:hypothetical protein